jgi:hypothetical protein
VIEGSISHDVGVSAFTDLGIRRCTEEVTLLLTTAAHSSRTRLKYRSDMHIIRTVLRTKATVYLIKDYDHGSPLHSSYTCRY